MSIAGIPIDTVVRQELQNFLLDNSRLMSHSSGLRYRASPDGEKNQSLKPVPWGKSIWGTLDETGEWLKVKPGRYLPVRVDGVEVLKVVPDASGYVSEEKEDAKDCRLGSLKVPDKFRPAAEQSSVNGSTGSWYQIVAERVALRQGPSLGAPAITSLRRGASLELFGWDETRQWRECLEPRTMLQGWLLLEHPQLGPLARPQRFADGAESGAESGAWRPGPALCDAAAEGRLEDLRCFLQDTQVTVVDCQGRRPLVLSACYNHLPCAVHLLEAGADAREALEECERRGVELDVMAAALLTAMAGGKANPSALQLMLNRLEGRERSMAEAMLARREPGRGMSKAELVDAMDKAGLEEVATEAPPDSPLNRAAEGKEAEPVTEAPGVLYEVAYQAIWIRQLPDSKSEKLTKRMKSDRFRLLDFDETGNWGRLKVVLTSGEVDGWVMLQHPDLGELIRKCEDDDDTGGLLKPEEL